MIKVRKIKVLSTAIFIWLLKGKSMDSSNLCLKKKEDNFIVKLMIIGANDVL